MGCTNNFVGQHLEGVKGPLVGALCEFPLAGREEERVERLAPPARLRYHRLRGMRWAASLVCSSPLVFDPYIPYNNIFISLPSTCSLLFGGRKKPER